MLQQFGADIGQPNPAGRAIEEPDAELILQIRDTATEGGGRHLHASRRFREAAGLDDPSEGYERVQIHGFFIIPNMED